MKIICVETVVSKPHLETSGEIALRFKENKNNIVKFAYLGRNLLWNDWQFPLFLKCLGFSYNKRISTFNEILIKNEIEILNDDKFDNFNKDKILNWSKRFKGDLNDLKLLKYKDILIGKSILSSLISFYRNFNLKIAENREKIQQLIYSSALILERSELLIKSENPDQIVTFNGRFSISYPIVAVAEKHGVKVLRHERGSNFDRFEIFKKSVHDIKYRYYMVKRYWRLSKENKKKIGQSYFADRLNKKKIGSEFGIYFLHKQKKNFLNINLNEKKLIVFYTSSDYEMAAVNDDRNQEEKFKLLHSVISKFYHEVHLVVRVHPDVKTKNIAEDLQWKKYNSSFCTVLESDDMTDSFKLLKKADVVIGYTSSILLEALYWKKNVYTLDSKNIFQYSKSIRLLDSKPKILHMLKEKYNFKKKYLSKSLLFGYYFKTYGIKFKYYAPSDFYNGKFMNETLEWKSKIILILERFGLKFIYHYFAEKRFKIL